MRVIESALNVAERFEAIVDRDNPHSEIFHLSEADVGFYTPVSDWLWTALQLANDIAYRTDGLFDVVAAGSGGSACWTDIDLSCKGMVRLRKKLFLSLGGIAQGIAVDLAVKALKETGVQAGLVDIGGRIRAFGPREWRVDYCGAGGEGNTIVPVLLRGDALAGFGSFFGDSQVVDTRTSTLKSSREWAGLNLLVRSPSCAMADALTKVTALNLKESSGMLAQFGSEATILSAQGAVQLRYVS